MILQNVIRLLLFAIPLVTFVTCGIMMAMADSMTLRESLSKKILLLYYAICAIIAMGVLFFPFAAEFLISVQYTTSIISLLLAVSGVVFYHLVHVVTQKENQEFFPRIHYCFVIPTFALLYGASFIWSINTNLLLIVSILLILFYILLVIRKISKQTTTERSNPENSPEELIPNQILLIGASVLFPLLCLAGLLLPQMEVYISCMLLIPSLMLMTNHLILVSRFSRHNHLLSTTKINTLAVPIYHTAKQEELNEIRKLDKKHFEEYFLKNKPFLNQNLKITDLLEIFDTNRTYISSFVNQTYGVSFSHYVNGWRLREVVRLKKMQQNKNKKTEQLLLKAGFANYRGYMRAKQFERENTQDE